MVSATGFGINAWRSAKFTPDNNCNIIQHAPVFKISDEGMDSVIDDGQELFHAGEIALVGIEVAEGNADTANACFNHASCDEEFFSCVAIFAGCGSLRFIDWESVFCNGAWRFFFKIDSICKFA